MLTDLVFVLSIWFSLGLITAGLARISEKGPMPISILLGFMVFGPIGLLAFLVTKLSEWRI